MATPNFRAESLENSFLALQGFRFRRKLPL